MINHILWDQRFLELAQHIAQWSKDPSTKCGAVIARNKRVISMGYNGFPQQVNDCTARYENRELKYKMVLHAEVNALMFAQQDLAGCTLYVWPMPPCSRCACQIIQAGIKRVVSIEPTQEQKERWGEDFEITRMMFKEAEVNLQLI